MNRVSVARLAVCLASGESLWLTGLSLLVDGAGILEKCPELFSRVRLLTGEQAQTRRE